MKNLILSSCFLICLIVFPKTINKIDLNKKNLKSIALKKNLVNIYYQDNTLFIEGLNINGNLRIFTIIGNLILNANIQNFSNLKVPVDLVKNNIYVVRVETADNRIFNRKIVVR